jgi:hypothetical protein
VQQLTPSILFLTAAVGLGAYLGWQYLRRVRSKPGLIALHLLLGGAGLEGVAMLLRGTPDGTVMPAGALVNTAALLLATAMISGFVTPMIAKRNPRRVGSIALATHVGFGAAGFVLYVLWILQMQG